MDRPPFVSLLFFLAAAAIIVAMFITPRGASDVETTTVEAQSPEIETPPGLPATRAGRIRQFADNWSAEPDYTPSFNALDPAIDLEKVASSPFDPSDDYFGLPRAGNYELVYGYCGSCHSLRIVMQQHATRQRWDELLDWMVAKQGMAEPPAEDRALLLEYLSANFGPAE